VPPVALAPKRPVARRAPSTFWNSTLALVSVAVGSALLLVLGLLVHFVPRVRRGDLLGRIGEFTVVETGQPAVAEQSVDGLSARVERWLSGYRWWTRFKQEVDIAGIEAAAAGVLVLTAIATLSCALVLSAAVGTPLVSLPVCVVGPTVMVTIVRWRVRRERTKFADQLAGHMEEVGAAMRAGHSVVASIASMADDATDPTRREFQHAVADERLGVSIDEALRPVAERMDCPDVKQLALVAALNQQTGGNMAEILDLIAAGVRERLDLRRELESLTAQARLSRWVVSALPPGILAVLLVLNPGFVHPLFHTVPGAIALSAAAGLVVAGSVVMRMILEMGV
jgi:tight adherence protein B